MYYNEERTEMVRSKIKTLGIVAVLMVLSVLALYFAQALLMPKYISNVKEGALIAEYYKTMMSYLSGTVRFMKIFLRLHSGRNTALQAISAAARSS